MISTCLSDFVGKSGVLLCRSGVTLKEDRVSGKTEGEGLLEHDLRFGYLFVPFPDNRPGAENNNWRIALFIQLDCLSDPLWFMVPANNDDRVGLM